MGEWPWSGQDSVIHGRRRPTKSANALLTKIGSPMSPTLKVRFLVTLALLSLAAWQSANAAAVAGIKFADEVKVAGADLQLNGLGVRNKLVAKVYAAGLYLQKKASTVEGVLNAEGPRRIHLVMLREVSSEEFGLAFLAGINNNSAKADKTRFTPQLVRFGEMFASVSGLNKGDVVDVDWLPGIGTQCYVNGKKLGDANPDIVFYNAILKIWLGDNPGDPALKPKLLASLGTP